MMHYTLRTYCLIATAVSAAALAIVFIAQYGFGLIPCELCLIERVPYAIVILLGLASYIVLRPRLLLTLIGICFLSNVFIGAFHVGVEQHWWEWHSTCSSSLDANDISKLRDQIMNAPRARCDDAAWKMFGISMAGYNAIASLVLAAVAFTTSLKGNPRHRGM